MSIRCTKAILNYPLDDATFKAVMFALADAAGKGDRCWPSISTLQARSGASRRSVMNKIQLAEKLSIISKFNRRDMSTVYSFSSDFLDRYGEKEDGEPRHYSQSSKQVNPEPNFLDLLDPSAGDAPLFRDLSDPGAGDADPSAGGANPGAGDAPKPKEEPKEEPQVDSGAVEFRKESTVEQFHRRWNELADQYRISRCVALDENMRKKVLTRLDGFSSHDVEPCEVMDNFFKAIERSPFLRGEVPPSGGRKLPFRLSIGWALAPTNFAKIYNNSYDGDRDEQGRDISGPKAVGPTAAAAANVRARFRSRPQ